MGGNEQVVAVVDANKSSVVVWWVNAGRSSDVSMSRLCGAWVLERGDAVTLECLVFGRTLLPTKAGARALRDAGIAHDRVLDLKFTLAAAISSRDKCQAAYGTEVEKRKPSEKLRPPQWPTFPEPLNVEKPPTWKGISSEDDVAMKAVSVAHWLTALCERWSDLEEERTKRRWLAVIDGTSKRPLPMVLVEAS